MAHSDSSGIYLPEFDQIAINKDFSQKFAEENNIDLNEILQSILIHEVTEKYTYKNWWIKIYTEEKKFLLEHRRIGLTNYKFGLKSVLGPLKESIIEFIVLNGSNYLNKKNRSNFEYFSYGSAMYISKALYDKKISFNNLARSLFTKHGMMDLNREMWTKIGPYSLSIIADLIEYDQKMFNSKENTYKNTVDFINGKRISIPKFELFRTNPKFIEKYYKDKITLTGVD